MVDGKVCNALSNYSSTQTCYICGARTTEMNNASSISKKKVNDKMLEFGLSPLHSWIRFMECLLHIAYRLEIKTWQVRSLENKQKVAQKKAMIQGQFEKQLGLLVDMPKQHAGNTNDGNTARIFFRNAEKTAKITGINLNLIQRFHVILECLASGYRLCSAKTH